MTDISKIISSGVVDSTQAVKEAEATSNSGEIGQQEFLQLLVAQLQAQDPLDPMENEEFAVNLAQFSQLEQLISINEKLDSETEASSTDFSSLASYLGQEVVLQTGNATVANGDGGVAWVDVPEDTEQLTLSLLDSRGNAVHQMDLGAATKGEQRFSLDDLDVADGTYAISIGAQMANGEMEPLEGHAAGYVTGFVPGDDPALVVNGLEINPSEVYRVNLVY